MALRGLAVAMTSSRPRSAQRAPPQTFVTSNVCMMYFFGAPSQIIDHESVIASFPQWQVVIPVIDHRGLSHIVGGGDRKFFL